MYNVSLINECVFIVHCVLSICMCILHIVFCTVCKYVLSICKLFVVVFLHCLSICKLFVVVFCTVCPYVIFFFFFLHCLEHAHKNFTHQGTCAVVHPDPSKAFVVEVDASTTGVGAVLSQQQGNPAKLHPCAAFYGQSVTHPSYSLLKME